VELQGTIIKTWRNNAVVAAALLKRTMLLCALLFAGYALANQTPATSTAGAAPILVVTKTYPGGTTMQIGVAGANVAFFNPSAALNATGGISAAQLSPAIDVATNASDMDINAAGCLTTVLRCANRGTITLTFSHAVTNPVIHISGLGGFSGGGAFYHSALIMSSSDAATLPTFSRLAGNTPFSVSTTEIRSSAINGGTTCTAATAAACGSVRINGTFTRVTMQVDLLMGGTGTPAGTDGWTITASVDEDFGDAPASYDTTAAASHIVGGFFMGTAPTVENAAVTNLNATPITPSPIANATASGDGNDDGVTFPSLVRGLAGNINVSVTGSGGRLQGWIDWAGDGSFATAGDQIATNVVDGGAGDTDGVVNGIIRLSVTPPVGASLSPTFARFRWSPLAGVAATGRGTVGEVEDYQVTVLPLRANLFLTKTVSASGPGNGNAISYTLTVTSDVSPVSTGTATGITVQDTLPAGFTFTSATGTGSYNNGTGVWNVGSLAPGASATLTINGTVSATSGTVTNVAQITASSLPDPNSTPNNNVTTEDDYAAVSFNVPTLLAAPVCAAGGTNQIITNGTFAGGTGPNWTGWTAASIWTGTNVASVSNDTVSGSVSQAGLTGLTFGPSAAGGAVIQMNALWKNPPPSSIISAQSTPAVLTVTVAGTAYARINTGFGGSGSSATVTYLNGASGNLTTLTEVTSSGWRINLPTTIAATGAISFDMVPGGISVPSDADPGGGLSDDFEIDNVTVYTCAPGQLSVTKISNVLTDGISATNPKAIPGATIRYCIVISNPGTATNSAISATDALPSNVTYVAGSARSGTTCANATTVEDDNAIGADENDPFGISITGTTVTGTAATLAPSAAFAIIFNATVN
jgi:uncharacterized repeat protein (TIGR01451 family)